MNLNLHVMHTFSVLIMAPSFIIPKWKGRNCSLQSCNFSIYLVESIRSILYIQEVLGHWSIKTTMISKNLTNKTMNGKQSTLYRLNLKQI
jgi:hypothetical protein